MYFLTKKGLKDLFAKWNVGEKPPKKNQMVVVCFPSQAEAAYVKKTNDKSTEGKTLYSIEFKI